MRGVSDNKCALCVWVVILIFVSFSTASGQGANPKPNIIVFMVDDLGWNHIGVGQSTMGTAKDDYLTPNIQKLADRGLSFTHAYAQPNCAPTRAAMLSGQYPARVNNNVYVVHHLNRFGNGGITEEAARFRGAEQSMDISAAGTTIAEALKHNGYSTAHIGKYHVGGNHSQETLPENMGFDINLGGFSQGNQATCFASVIEGKWAFKATGLGHFDKYASPYTEAYVKERTLPRSLIGAEKHISDALGDAMEDTVRQLVASNKPFYLQFHTYAVHGPVRARPDLRAIAAERLEGEGNKMVEYLGFILGVDENVGRVLDVIQDPNRDGDRSDSIAAKTLLLFTSDNGGTHFDNVPLRGVKGEFTEGGIRVPLIAYWPGVVHANTVTDYKVHSVDYYPTCLELAGSNWAPPESQHPLDGESFADILINPKTTRERGPIYFLFPGYMDWRAEPTVAIIDDLEGSRFKLLYYYETDSWELYDLIVDQGEANDLIQSRGDIATTLSKKLDEWLRQSHPTWDPKYPIHATTGRSAGPPELFSIQP